MCFWRSHVNTNRRRLARSSHWTPAENIRVEFASVCRCTVSSRVGVSRKAALFGECLCASAAKCQGKREEKVRPCCEAPHAHAHTGREHCETHYLKLQLKTVWTVIKFPTLFLAMGCRSTAMHHKSLRGEKKLSVA